MGYVAVKGGQNAIEESIKRLSYQRLKSHESIEIKTIQQSLRLHVAQVMSEASLYDPYLAALAIKQGEGSLEEAVFLLRAYRSTLPRNYYSSIVESNSMMIKRRISAAFKDIEGGQILGTTYDYVHRLLDFSLCDETKEKIESIIKDIENMEIDESQSEYLFLPKVSDYLRNQGLLPEYKINNEEPKDVTKHVLSFPTVRSERLQILTRGMTQAVEALAYASLRGYGATHPTVSELRVGDLPIVVPNPSNCDDGDDGYYIGEIEVTEVESLIPVTKKKDDGSNELEFKIGYGIALGQNETKAIAMSCLDNCLEDKEHDFPVNDEEFVLYHIDAVEASGFISHLKLPHYVTFSSKLNSVRKLKKEGANHE